MADASDNETKNDEPVLSVRGKLVGLGSMLPQHLDAWLKAIADPELNIYSDGGFALPSREKEAALFEGTQKGGGANFAIYALPEEKFIGIGGLFQVEQLHQFASLGISIIDKTYWSKGYGTEAVRLIADYGFRFLNLHNIELKTLGYNQRGIRAYEKAGFKHIGRRRETIALAGKRYDLVQMDCLATEFEPPEPGWFKLAL